CLPRTLRNSAGERQNCQSSAPDTRPASPHATDHGNSVATRSVPPDAWRLRSRSVAFELNARHVSRRTVRFGRATTQIHDTEAGGVRTLGRRGEGVSGGELWQFCRSSAELRKVAGRHPRVSPPAWP